MIYYTVILLAIIIFNVFQFYRNYKRKQTLKNHSYLWQTPEDMV